MPIWVHAVATVMAEATVAAIEVVAMVAVQMKPVDRAGEVTVIGVANRGIGPRTTGASSLRKIKKNMCLQPKRRRQRSSMPRFNLRCHRWHVGVAAVGESRMGL
jgi:hypothetical protein